MTRTAMARFKSLIRFRISKIFFRPFKKTNIEVYFNGIFLIFNENVCFVHSLESRHRGNSDNYTRDTIIV